MYNNLKTIIFKNIKVIIFTQFIVFLFALTYFYNSTTSNNYSIKYQNAYIENLNQTSFILQTVNPIFHPNANYYQIDYFYNLIFDNSFKLSDKCRVSGFNNNNLFSTKNDTGFSFKFKFSSRPILNISFRDNDKIKAKKCAEEYAYNIFNKEKEILNKMAKIYEQNKYLYDLLETKIYDVSTKFLDIANNKINNFDDDVIDELSRNYDFFTNSIRRIKESKYINYQDPIILNSEYEKIKSSRDIYIIIIFIFFGLMSSAIIILIKDYKL